MSEEKSFNERLKSLDEIGEKWARIKFLLDQFPVPPAVSSHKKFAYNALAEARRHQDEKWGEIEQRFDVPWLPVLVEEVGEVAEALQEFNKEHIDRDALREHLVYEIAQVAAVAVAWMERIEYERNKRSVEADDETS